MGLQDEVDELTSDLAFSNADTFPGVETFTYHRRGKSPLSVTGPVFRDPPELDPQTMSLKRRLRVFVSVAQVDSVDCPGDVIEVAAKRGGTAEKHTVREILNQDAGGWELLLG